MNLHKDSKKSNFWVKNILIWLKSNLDFFKPINKGCQSITKYALPTDGAESKLCSKQASVFQIGY